MGWIQEKVLTPDPCMTLDKLLPSLPLIMHNKGWVKGETLMNNWFRQASNNNPGNGSHDVTTITMDWVLSYPRAKAVYEEAIKERVWVNSAAQDEIRGLIKKTNKFPPSVGGSKMVLGDVGKALVRSSKTVDQFHKENAIQKKFRPKSSW